MAWFRKNNLFIKRNLEILTLFTFRTHYSFYNVSAPSRIYLNINISWKSGSTTEIDPVMLFVAIN